MAETPFGTMSEGVGKAPTAAEVAANPGAYAGTAFDPVKYRCHRSPLVYERMTDVFERDADGNIQIFHAVNGDDTWAAMYRWNRTVARRFFAAEHDGNYMDESRLTPEQRIALGW